jgi:hypothetical protein
MALAKAVRMQVFEGGVKPTSITKILMTLPKLGAKLMLVRGKPNTHRTPTHATSRDRVAVLEGPAARKLPPATALSLDLGCGDTGWRSCGRVARCYVAVSSVQPPCPHGTAVGNQGGECVHAQPFG